MGRPKGGKNKTLHRWTDEEKKFIKKITPGNHYNEIQEIMIKKFNYDFTFEQIKGALSRYKLSTGFTGCFQAQHVPFNKGMKGICAAGSEKGWFKKGDMPSNHDIVGTEKIQIDGYIKVKITEPNIWKLKHQLEYEKYNGPIKKGYAVIFGDGNRQNFNINNLILVTRYQLLTLNRYKLITNNTELTKTGVIIADLYQAISNKGR